VEALAIEKVLWVEPGKGIAATGHIPRQSEFFQDHFPGFPVLPGVLALEMLKQTAEAYLNQLHEVDKKHYYLKRIFATKFSKYLMPGDEWESRLELIKDQGDETQCSAKLMHQGKAAVSAKLILSSKKTQTIAAS